MLCCTSSAHATSTSLTLPSSAFLPPPPPPLFLPSHLSSLPLSPSSTASSSSSPSCFLSDSPASPSSSSFPRPPPSSEFSSFSMTASFPDSLHVPSLHGFGPRHLLGPYGLGRKRFPVSDLEELMDSKEADGYLLVECEGSLSSKRLRGSNGWVSAGGCNMAAHAGDSTNAPSGAETGVDSSRNETGKFQTVAKAHEQKIENASCEASKGCFEDASIIHYGDLDDFLDILLQKTEPVSLEPSPTALQSYGSSRISCNGSESSHESPPVLVNSQQTQFSISAQHYGGRDLSFAWRMSPLSQREDREQTRTFRDRIPRRSWDWQAPPREQPVTASAHTHSFPNCSDSNHSSREEGCSKLKGADLLQQSQLKPPGCKRDPVQVWAGPTLLEIESALAHKDSSPLMYSPATIDTVVNSPPLLLSMVECEAARPIGSSAAREDGARSGVFRPKEEQKLCNSWKSLLKRGAGEPKYTLKLRCEEEAVNDGYRWRKYGQKTIKGSPYPRSYYRCTSCKCSAKKQVERSSDDPRLLLVTYDGIHLHPQPNPHANCMSSHLVDHNTSPLPRTSSLSPSSSSSCVATQLSSPDAMSDLGTRLRHYTSPSPSCVPRSSPCPSSSPC